MDGCTGKRSFCFKEHGLHIIGGLLMWAFLMPGDHHGKWNSSSPAGAHMPSPDFSQNVLPCMLHAEEKVVERPSFLWHNYVVKTMLLPRGKGLSHDGV